MDNPQVIPNDIFREFTTWIRRKMYILIGGLGIILMLLAVTLNYVKVHTNKSAIEDNKNSLGKETVFTDLKEKGKVKIDIEGAVEKPGLYEVTNDSRIQDVLITAGGMTAKADRIYISKNINLAQRVYDGQKIFFPEENSVVNQSMSQNQTNLISLNTATESQLDTLPGIGAATAKKIIDNRPYQNISDLIEKHLVSQSVYLKIKDLISL